jgi:hypothetical protein
VAESLYRTWIGEPPSSGSELSQDE